MRCVLLTGAAGFIGSHTSLLLLDSGYKLFLLDNFSNSSQIALKRVVSLSKLSPHEALERVSIINGDIRDFALLDNIFKSAKRDGEQISFVIHFAGLKSVGESFKKATEYWDNNVGGTLTLLKAMEKNSCRNIIFSSSATVYGPTKKDALIETDPISPINPYGSTKAAIEKLLANVAGCQSTTTSKQISQNGWKIACLRYFNPAGAHPSGEIGENPKNIPNNLFPLINEVAIGKKESLTVFGNNWPTFDGTCIRDYVHVMDIAEGHKAALETLISSEPQLLIINLGTGKGTSVIELIRIFTLSTGIEIPYKFGQRRHGDSAISLANPMKALKHIKWQSKRKIEDICRDGWNWQSKNPSGYINNQ
tara:strand:- start:3548 stop:4639 length:1092 start_codon:yes stop_codon:yes gene_type:complete